MMERIKRGENEKKNQSRDVVLQPVPSAWTYDTHMNSHTASVYHSSSFLSLEMRCCVTCCWKLIPSSSFRITQTLHSPTSLSPLKTIRCRNPTTCSMLKLCIYLNMQFAAYKETYFTSSQQVFFTASSLCTLRGNLSPVHFPATTCLFAEAVCMVNKRWMCSRINTLKWLPGSTQWSQTHLPSNYPFFISTDGCCFQTEK